MQKQQPPLQQEGSFTPAKLYMWVKGLESKVNNLLREVDVLKNDFINRSNNLKKEFKDFNIDLLEFKHEQQQMQQKMDLIIKELKRTAGKEEVDVLKKYLDIWSPLNFVTQRDVERLVIEHVERVHKVLKRDVNTKKNLIRKVIRQRKAKKRSKKVSNKKTKRKVIHHAN
jgi:hypothetical protein